MARVTPIITNTNGGEWSPNLYGRVDIGKYANSFKTVQNFIPMVQGPSTRRPGFHFVNATKSNGVALLIPFEFSTLQAYMIEAGDLYFRFYRERGQILSSGSPYEVTTPYAAAHVPDLKWAQSADVLYLTHPSYAPRKLSRTGHTAWTLSSIDFLDGPYLDENTTDTTLTPSAATGSVTLTASAIAGINGGTGFQTTDVGRLVRIKEGAVWGWGKITARASTTSVTLDVKSTLTNTTAKKIWQLGAWSDTTGYPSCVTFHEERLCFAGSTNQPQTVWMSKSGDYENFAPTETDGDVLADDAITVTISDSKVNAIRWMESAESLFLGTVGGEKLIRANTLGEALTPDNVTAKGQTTRGCANALPVRLDRAILFIQRARKKLHEIKYSFENDSYAAEDVSILAHHLTRPGLKQIAYQATPWSVVWIARDDGVLIGFTYERDQQALAWHRHPIAGANAKVLSLACIPGNGQDELWAVIERTINGGTKRYIEYLGYEFAPADENDKAAAFFVDSGLSYSGALEDTFTGLGHLEGQVVSILADGATHPARTVSGGAVTLDREASTVHVGLAYSSEIETMDLEAGSAIGTAQGKKKRINKVTVRLIETLGCHVGRAGHMDEVLFRSGSDPMNASPPLFTGDKTIEFAAGWDQTATVRITQSLPLPCTVTAIVPSLTTNDG